MKPKHFRAMKFNTIYSVSLAIVSVALLLLFPDISLIIACAFLVLYVAGNGVIHWHHDTLSRDAIVEYIILSLVAVVLVVGALS